MYKRLKQLRKNYNLSQKEISQFLEISSSQYSLYESGKRQIPIHLLLKLAKFYNTSLDYIVEDTNQLERYN